jgi:hypothetical protein
VQAFSSKNEYTGIVELLARMEDFFDYILLLLLIVVIIVTSLLIFLLIKNPLAGYILIIAVIFSIAGGIGILGRKLYQKKRLGSYYEMFQDISQSHKEIHRSSRYLERPLQKIIKPQFPKIQQLCQESQRCVYKIVEIDKVLSTLEKKQTTEHRNFLKQVIEESSRKEKLRESDHRYWENIKTITNSKKRYLQTVHQVLQFLQELNSHILALKYSPFESEIHIQIPETIDDLLIEIRTLKEMT